METAIYAPQKKKRWKRTAWLTLAIVFFALAGIGVFVSAYIHRSLPIVEGKLAVPGLLDEVSVIRDSHGVPHIFANNEHDLFFAQGFVQAQDRLFQMDLSRRQASGQLSEVVGVATIERDKFFRTLGLRRAAEASYHIYSAEAKQVLEAFAQGVNAYITWAKRTDRLPVEFRLLGYEPKPWTPVDSLVIGKYMAFDLGGHWEGQVFRYWALNHLPKEKAYDLFPSYPKEAPVILPAIDVEQAFAAAVLPSEWNGSNNWVVSGRKTKSGQPMLANDPHLSLSTPSIWYQMHLQAPTVNVSGVIFAGVPGIILGHNDYIAWGVTNTGPDVQDLYVEKRNPANKQQFLYNGRWENAKIIEEPIRVKGGKTIRYRVTITRHGPVLSEFAVPASGNDVLALRWTALDPSTELQAVLEMNKAKNWKQFEQALEHFHAPTQNFVFAAKDGTIAYKANGKIPIRKKGNGLLPVPGWTDEYEWIGFIPFDRLPRAVNPREGFIATANNKVVGDHYPYHLSHHWAQPYRYMRIAERLQSKDDWTPSEMKRLQMDQMNLWAKEFVPLLLKHVASEPLSKQERSALHELKQWDFVDHKEQAAPLIFHRWMEEIADVLFERQIPPTVDRFFEGKQSVVDELLRRADKGDVSPWFRDGGGFSRVLAEALSRTVRQLADEYGNDPAQWKWGNAHRLFFAHPLSSASPMLAFFLNKEEPIPIGGSDVTVQAASYTDEGIVNHGASWRFVIDLADPERGWHIVGPGQAGHFRSRWYHDQIDDWVNGTYHVTSLGKVNGSTLVLRPE
ncbi:penicillin acylase family protein [Geobacillus sp. C56-T2]|uniref:penicillin acylase family protein n=1 Tax=Geobacillus sp. C56-T2 TaxID=600773 RepID=UPI0011A12741|nr:penicillin acylase family protein [Geobacillus sp. C56-T2]NNV06266.1 penicillin acylase family protein [Geobacillus sp. MMMUD3]TWG30270.1 penicillin amidase [Geobacillus sp. C56-T2]